MERYLERAENTARLIQVNTHLLLDLPRNVTLGWEPIIDMLSFRDVFYDLYKEVDEKSVIKFMVTDTNNPGSIINCLAAVRENARIIREIIPSEAWEQINNLYIAAKADGQSVLTRRHRFNCLHRIIVANQTITGLLGGTMLRGEGYAFLRLGRHLERTDMTSRIIDVRSASLLPDLSPEQSAFENIQWMGVLKSLTAYQMYRQEMRIRINRADVLEFLINNKQFPRSLQHGLMQIGKCLLELPNSQSISQHVEALSEELQKLDTHELTQDRLHEVIDDIQLGVVKIHQSINSQYF
jgi:uncharacterized alpha-E superfamily protein